MYSHKLVSNPLIYAAEAGLVLLFLMHLGVATKLNLQNMCARDQKYAENSSGDKSTSHVAKGMWAQGVVILIFIVLHIITFKYGTHYTATYDGVEVRDLFKLMSEFFQNPIYVAGYIITLIVLGLHLSHGIDSSFKSLGFNHPQYELKVKILSHSISFFVAAGFIIQPIYMFLKF